MTVGIRGKFLVPTLVLIFLGTSLTATISFINSRKTIKQSTIEQMQQNAASTLEYITSWIENRKQDVLLWSQQAALIQTLDLSGSDSDSGSIFMIDDVNKDLKKYKKAHPYFEEIGVAVGTGQVLTTTDIEKVAPANVNATEIRGKDYFKGCVEGNVVVTDARISDKSGRPVIVIAAPIWSVMNEGSLAGMIYGVVDLLHFTKRFVEPIKIGQEGYVYIYNRDGMVVAHRDLNQILKTNISSFDFGRQMLSEVSGWLDYSVEGHKRWVAFKNDKQLGWTVAAVASVDELLKPVGSLLMVNAVMTLLVLAVALFVIIAVAQKVCKPIITITDDLNAASQEVSRAADQISESSQQLANGASDQASSIEETSASLEELAAMSSHNADNARQAKTLSDDACSAAENGAGAMEKLVQAMTGINESSHEVAKVARGIEEIAFQTNLLALNAAVEAARAGEAGRGFAVVAEEVRNLAQRASEQARITSTLITESSQRTEEGNKQAGEAHDLLKGILESVEKVSGLVSEISAASKEQAQGIDQINKAVSSMDHIVQQNAASSEESASASKQLNSQAFNMKNLVNRLASLVEGIEAVSEISADQAREFLQPVNNKAGYSSPRPAPRKASLPEARQDKSQGRPEDIIPFDEDDMEDF